MAAIGAADVTSPLFANFITTDHQPRFRRLCLLAFTIEDYRHMSSPTLRSILEACDRLDCLCLFDEHEIAPEQLPGLTGDDLKEIGIEKLGHRKAILAAIAEAFARPTAEGQETGNEPVLSALAATAAAAVAPSSDEASTEATAQAADATDRPKIFLSYGRRDASELAQRLCRDLEAVGFEVWMDVERLVPGSRWQEEIEEALREAQVVVSLLSPHAVRRGSDSDPTDSVCLDELALARAGRPPTPVVPAMVAACEPPLIIYRLDYVDLLASQQSEDEYRRGFDRLVSGIREALVGKVRYRFWDDRLRPLDFSDYLARKRDGFVGREWLFDEIDLWRYESAERALLITGDPGAGKSSIVAQLAHTNPGGQVIAYYFCQSHERETLRPARFVQSVAAMIASRLPAYAEQFEVPAVREALDEQRCERDPGGSFLAGILQPLQKLPDPGEGVRYLLVDALDEALLHGGETNILDVLAGRIERFPTWLRLVATTRNEPSVLQRLSGLRPKRLDAADPRNLADLGAWIHHRLLEPALAEQLVESRAIADRVVEALLEKSTGNFLYAVNALNGIERGFYSFAHLAALPPGLDGLYLDFFRRLFGREGTAEGEAAYARARPLLQALTAAIEPLSRAELAAASGLDAEEELPRLLRRLAQLHVRRDRPNGEETIAFYHKSIADWLVSNPDGNAFAISPAKGRALLAAFCRSALDTSRAEPCWYVRRHAVAHLLEAGDWDGATAALADLEFIGARAVAQELPAMLVDYARAECLLPEGAEERKLADERQAELDRYTLELVEYAAAWTRIRDGAKEAEPALPRPVKSVRPWSEERIAAERQRMTDTPNRLDRVKAFRLFVATNTAPLQAYSTNEGFLANLARNDAPAGPVHEAGARLLAPMKVIKLVRQFAQTDVYNPLPTCQAIFEGHENFVSAVALSAHGRRAVSGAWDNTIRVWDIETGQCLKVVEGHTNSVTSVALSADGRFALSGSYDKTLRLWNLNSGECVNVLKGHTDSVESVDLSADGRLAVSGSRDKTVRVWDLKTGECLKVLKGHTDSVESVDLSADGRLAVSGSDDKTVRLWNLDSGVCLGILEGHPKEVATVRLSANARHVTSSCNEQIRVWDFNLGICNRVIEIRDFCTISVALSKNGNWAMTASIDYDIFFWDLESGNCISRFVGSSLHVSSIAISLDGSFAVSGSWEKTLRVWNLKVGDCPQFSYWGIARSVSLTLNGNLMSTVGRLAVTVSRDHLGHVWDLDSGERLQVLKGHSDEITQVEICKDERRAISGSADNTLRVWDLNSGECLRVLEGHTKPVRRIYLSANDRLAILRSDDNTYRVWDIDSGVCINIPEGQFNRFSDIALSADSRIVASVSKRSDWRITVLEIASGTFIEMSEGHSAEITSIALSVDGRKLVSGSFDRTLRLWDTKSGQCLRVFNGDAGDVTFVAMCADGCRALSTGWDQMIRIWDLENGNCLAKFFLRFLPQVGHSISASLRTLAFGLTHGRVEFYQIENLSLGPFITTARRELVSEDLPAGPVTARPVCCGQEIAIPPILAGCIEYWHLAGHDRGDHAYTDSALLLDCPSCGTPLRMNPFFEGGLPINPFFEGELPINSGDDDIPF